MRYNGFELDLVGLRSEIYNDTQEERTLTLVAALLLPLRSKATPYVSQILSQSLKWPKTYARNLMLVHKQCGSLAETFPDIKTGEHDRLRVRVGTIVQRLSSSTYKPVIAALWGNIQQDELRLAKTLKKVCEKIERTIEIMNLACCWERKPLLNGIQIQQQLGIDSGIDVGRAIEKLRVFHLKYPLATAADAEEFLRS